MSQGQRVPITIARGIAGALVGLLAPACDRIEIAGSIRRRKPFVGDIEIVAIPRIGSASVGMFGVEDVDLLGREVDALIAGGSLAPRQVQVHRKDGAVETQQRMGERYKALVFHEMAVDLFITEAEMWGTVFALRTGPGDWNTKLVTDCQRYFRRVEGLRVLHLGRPVPTPEETDFFAAIGQPWVEPWERSVERVAIGRPA